MRAKRKFWTKEQLGLLESLYPTTPALQLAKRFNRELQHVYAKAHKLGLHRLDNPGSIRKGERRGVRWEFKKGVSSWNAGKKVGTRGRSGETQFKKGQVSANTLYDGAITARTDWAHKKQRKYQWIRVGKKKWKELHRLVWEHHKGPIPAGHIVIFVDGDTMNCRIENLSCITRQQHAENTRMKDGYIAKCLASMRGGKGKIDRTLYARLLKSPLLLEAKRQQMRLNRTLKEQREPIQKDGREALSVHGQGAAGQRRRLDRRGSLSCHHRRPGYQRKVRRVPQRIPADRHRVGKAGRSDSL